MAPLAAISNSHPEQASKILDEIEVQFKLDDVALTRITTQFLQEISNGLSEYGQAMAVMYVRPHHYPLILTRSSLTLRNPVQLSSPVFHRARRRGQ